MQHRSSMLGHFNYSSCQRPDPPCASCIFRCCAFRENNTATFPSYFHTPFSSHRDNSPPFLKKKSSFHVLLIQKQKKESGNTRFHTARIKYLMLERKKNGWKVAHGETSWNGKLRGTPCISLSLPPFRPRRFSSEQHRGGGRIGNVALRWRRITFINLTLPARRRVYTRSFHARARANLHGTFCDYT